MSLKSLLAKIPIREIWLAILSAIVGAVVAWLLQGDVRKTSEVTVLETILDSQVTDLAFPPEAGKPLSHIANYSIKNTGDVALTDVTIEFAPEGGDSAYGPGNDQDVVTSTKTDSERTGRRGSKLSRIGNSFLLHYDRLDIGEVDDVSFLNDGLADSYSLSSNSADLNIKLESNPTSLDSELPIYLRPNLWGKFGTVIMLIAGLALGIAISFLSFKWKSNA